MFNCSNDPELASHRLPVSQFRIHSLHLTARTINVVKSNTPYELDSLTIYGHADEREGKSVDDVIRGNPAQRQKWLQLFTPRSSMKIRFFRRYAVCGGSNTVNTVRSHFIAALYLQICADFETGDQQRARWNGRYF